MHSACQDAHWHSWLSAACAAREYEERKCGPCGMSSGKEPEYLCVAKVFYPTSLPSCSFISLLFSLCPILEECGSQASRHFCIYFLFLFIHALAPQAAFLRQMYLPHTHLASLIYLILFFMGHYLKGGGKDLWNI